MKSTKISIKNLFGIKQLELDGNSVELSGSNGVGKTSVIDAIKYALTNKSDRKYIIRNGESEGEVLIETDSNISILRKKREEQADYKSIKNGKSDIAKPESFLQEIFTTLQLNPVEFSSMTEQEQNRIILDLIEFEWDLNWVKEQFGEIPSWVNYEQNILNVLHEIQSEKGGYYLERQDLNRDARHKKDHVADIAKDIPANYDFDKWDKYDLSKKYQELNTLKDENSKIERARAFKDSYDNKKRAIEAEKEIKISSEKSAMENTKSQIKSTIERLKAELKAEEEKLGTLDSILEDKIKLAQSEFNEKVAKLDADTGIAQEYAEKQLNDFTELTEEVSIADAMRKHLNEYKRMQDMQREIDTILSKSEELTQKIERARTLPAEILKTAKLPIKNLEVKNGVVLINGLPVSNLSEGEKLKLCVDIAISKPSQLQIILLDGVEKLSDKNRNELYKLCKEKGLQFIATRTTNDDELIITTL